jgi:DNA uptake protein ComE-like DNA-binding protein
MIVTMALALVASPLTRAQVGQGVLDLNAISEADLAALPNMTAAAAKAFVAKRPFATIVDANATLLAQGLTAEQLAATYEKAFVHLNLNTCTPEEILLVPKIARRMRIEFPEYRPWKSWAQFDKEIGKYVGADETNRLKRYVFIPVNLNTASDEDILTIPGVGARMLREFKEYRPWTSKAQFDKEIGKYVDAKEVARLWRFVVIQ